MSTTHTQLVDAFSQAMTGMGFNLTTSEAAPQKHSPRAGGGSGSKVVATLREIREEHGGRGAEHGNSATTGAVTFSLAPSKASPEINLVSMGALMELGHRAVIKMDGISGIRASLQSVRASVSTVEFTAALVLGAVVTSTDTDDALLGRV